MKTNENYRLDDIRELSEANLNHRFNASKHNVKFRPSEPSSCQLVSKDTHRVLKGKTKRTLGCQSV